LPQGRRKIAFKTSRLAQEPRRMPFRDLCKVGIMLNSFCALPREQSLVSFKAFDTTGSRTLPFLFNCLCAFLQSRFNAAILALQTISTGPLPCKNFSWLLRRVAQTSIRK
jgi:hypothetical protein